LSNGHPLQEAIEVSKALDEKDPFVLHAWHFSFVGTSQNGAIDVIGLTSKRQTYNYGIGLSTNTPFFHLIVR
jgi:hypothetical protein